MSVYINICMYSCVPVHLLIYPVLGSFIQGVATLLMYFSEATCVSLFFFNFELLIWEFPKLGEPYVGVLIIRILLPRVLC